MQHEGKLQWLEQPLPPSDHAGLLALGRRLPVALDESLRHPSGLPPGWSGWLVHKPALEGDPRPLLLQLKQGAAKQMVSSALESGIGAGRLPIMAALASRGPTPCAAGLAPGWGASGDLASTIPQQVWGGRRLANGWELRASALEEQAGRDAMTCCQRWPEGSGVVIGSGSSGGRKWCLQSWENLEQSASSCADWLQAIGVDPSCVQLVNPLPSHHMGGLMPQIRARQWQAPLVAIAPELMKSPGALLEQHGNLNRGGRDAVISLVPTQLQRLLGDPSGRSWLQQFRLLWIGGGPQHRAG